MRLSDRALRILALAVIGLSMSSCAYLQEWDKSRDVAYDTLFNPDRRLNVPAYSAAIAARFPPGSPAQALEDYVKSQSGSCHPKETSKLWCDFPVRGGFCYAVLIGIEASVKAGAIESTTVIFGGLGC